MSCVARFTNLLVIGVVLGHLVDSAVAVQLDGSPRYLRHASFRRTAPSPMSEVLSLAGVKGKDEPWEAAAEPAQQQQEPQPQASDDGDDAATNFKDWTEGRQTAQSAEDWAWSQPQADAPLTQQSGAPQPQADAPQTQEEPQADAPIAQPQANAPITQQTDAAQPQNDAPQAQQFDAGQQHIDAPITQQQEQQPEADAPISQQPVQQTQADAPITQQPAAPESLQAVAAPQADASQALPTAETQQSDAPQEQTDAPQQQSYVAEQPQQQPQPQQDAPQEQPDMPQSLQAPQPDVPQAQPTTEIGAPQQQFFAPPAQPEAQQQQQQQQADAVPQQSGVPQDHPAGEEPKFFAFKSQLQGTVPIFNFWNADRKEHTFHAGEPRAGEVKVGIEFFAFTEPMDSAIPVYGSLASGDAAGSDKPVEFYAFPTPEGAAQFATPKGQEANQQFVNLTADSKRGGSGIGPLDAKTDNEIIAVWDDTVKTDRAALVPPLQDAAGDRDWYSEEYAYRKSNALENLSYTHPQVQPSQAQIQADAQREADAWAQIKPQVEAEEQEAQNYYHTNYTVDAQNPLEDFTESNPYYTIDDEEKVQLGNKANGGEVVDQTESANATMNASANASNASATSASSLSTEDGTVRQQIAEIEHAAPTGMAF